MKKHFITFLWKHVLPMFPSLLAIAMSTIAAWFADLTFEQGLLNTILLVLISNFSCILRELNGELDEY